MLPAAAPFLMAIAADPDDALPRLAFADHLDDTGRPDEAAAVRVDVALAAERPWGDRFWQLRTEQGELPAGVDRLSDRVPLLCGVPDDWRSRWRAVRAFVSRWWGVPLGDAGRWGEAVATAEQQAGCALPPAVREWAAFAAELTGLDAEAIRDPLGFGRWPAGAAGDTAWLLGQAEGDLFWGVLRDPPTDPDRYVLTLDADGGPYFTHSGNRYAGTVAGFALLYLLSYRNEQVPLDAVRHAYLRGTHPHAGRFDLAEVFEGPGRAAVLLPPNTWGHQDAQLFTLADDAG